MLSRPVIVNAISRKKPPPGVPTRSRFRRARYNSLHISSRLPSSRYIRGLKFSLTRFIPALLSTRRDGKVMSDFGELLEAQIPRLRRYARALTRDAVRADDLVQSCLLRALSKAHLWQPGTDLRAWLFTILHNQHVNIFRR